MSATSEEELAQAARSGDRAALEELIARIQKRIYNLAVRMLWHPSDAEDATQEILIKIVTHLSDFRGDSRFATWGWRIATNHLLTTRKRRAEQQAMSLEDFARDLDQGLSDHVDAPSEVEERLLVEEVKVGCMQAMLLCLNREQRAAYVLGEIFEVTDREGAEIFGISPTAYRKRLSRARETIRSFMQRKCGLVNPDNPCRCGRRVTPAVRLGRVDPHDLLFARHGEDEQVLRGIREMEQLVRAAALFKSHPTYEVPTNLTRALSEVLNSDRVSFLK